MTVESLHSDLEGKQRLLSEDPGMLSFDKRYEKRNTLVLCFNFLHLHSVLICSTPSSQYIYNLRKPHWHKDCVLWRLHSFCLEIRKELRTLGFPNSSGGKESPAMQETLVRFLGRENRLEKGKATHSSILAWRIPWTIPGITKSQTWLSNFHFHSQ